MNSAAAHNSKLVAIDLDDTLLRDDGTVSDYTRRVIRQAQAENIYVLIATGRMYQTARPTGLALGLGDIPMVLFSGGLIQRIESGEILYKNPIDLTSAKAALGLAKRQGWYIQAYVDDELLVHHHCEESRSYEHTTGATAVAIGEDLYELEKAPSKLLMLAPKEQLDTAAEVIRTELGNRLGLVRSKVNYLEIMAPNASKGSAMLHLGRHLGITAQEMVAFGNSENDISMLKDAGCGIAVENAEPHIRQLADIVCSSNNDDGVARWIEDNLLQR